MRVTIELRPGEEPLSRAQLAEIASRVRLRKASAKASDREPRKMDLEALQGSIDRSRVVVEAVRRRMVAKLERVIEGG